VIPFGKVSTGDIAATYATESMNDWSRERRGRDAGVTNAVTDGAAMNADFAGFEARQASDDSVTFMLDSPDGDQGFPGNIHIELTYTLTDNNELHLDYRASFNDAGKSALISGAESGRAPLETPLNLTNHSYFNLNGHDSGTVLTQEVMIDAEYFTEADRRSIPTGTLLEVKWTPMDFRKPKALGKEIDADYEQLKFGGGYDHNFVVGDGHGEYREVASMYSGDSGIRMTVATDLPGIQLYTANGLDNEMGKDDAVYGRRSSACFETQFWPDTINKENFPGGILREGEEFISRTTYAFSVVE
jgi:aldose 1-epimerase